MEKLALRVSNLGKRYRIGARQKDTLTKRERLIEVIGSPFAYLRNTLRKPVEDEVIWAVNDMSFEIKKGEVVGFIGRNGAGKSTLLKLLSRITEPTTGKAEIFGEITALLEIGTGFHPDLTGRENIYVNGAIMGMSRQDITKRFDEIVSFAEVEKFIDTPVKYYSSGMYVRLAFSVSAHLNADILLIDEVLAVGDTAFQRKCLSKMDDVAKGGRTVLFVSHSMPTVTRLCNRLFLLDYGRIVMDGVASDVVKEYLKIGMQGLPHREWIDVIAAPGNNIAKLRAVRVILGDGQTSQFVDIRYPFGIEMTYDVLLPGHRLYPQIRLFNAENICLFTSADTAPDAYENVPRASGAYTSTAWIPGNLLAEGNFNVSVALSEGPSSLFHENGVVTFEVIDPMEGDSVRGEYTGDFPGIMRPKLQWETMLNSEFTIKTSVHIGTNT